MVYLDNAATSKFKPECVQNAVLNSLKYLSANPGRGGHSMSLKCARLVHKARTAVSYFVGLDCASVVFTLNCTHALNLAILGNIKKGGHIITTLYEHNSVLRPLHELARKGDITLSVLPPDDGGAVSSSSILSALNPNTYMVVTNHISNVTGGVTPVQEIGRLCKRKGLLYLVDAAQSGGYVPINMKDDNIDMLALAPHKGLHAPMGIGVLAMQTHIQPQPVLYGGTGTDSVSLYQPDELPESLESGTLPTPAIAGTLAGVNWSKIAMLEYADKGRVLSEYALSELKKIDGVRLYSAPSSVGGMISFNVGDMHSGEFAQLLSSQYDICVRGGLHCAPLIHKYLGTLQSGIVRASVGVDTTFSDIEYFIKAVKELAR